MVQQASQLRGHDPKVLVDLTWDGSVEAKREGETWFIERDGLHDFQKCLWLVQHLDD
jgi:hypothetical protein